MPDSPKKDQRSLCPYHEDVLVDCWLCDALTLLGDSTPDPNAAPLEIIVKPWDALDITCTGRLIARIRGGVCLPQTPMAREEQPRREYNWLRYRFECPAEDYRPVKFPPPGPYWCTGYNPEGCAILVAYVPIDDDETCLRDYWPDAQNESWTRERELRFTSRFPCPSWWPTEEESP